MNCEHPADDCGTLPPKGRCWVYSKHKMLQEIQRNNIWFGVDGNAVPRLKRFLGEQRLGLTPETLWRASEVGTTTAAKKHQLSLFKERALFDTPKPEQLIHRILPVSTTPAMWYWTRIWALEPPRLSRTR